MSDSSSQEFVEAGPSTRATNASSVAPGQAEQELERAEVVVGGDRAGDRVERGAGLQQAAAETRAGARPADADASAGRGVDELPGDREGVLLEPGRDEERRPVASRGGEVARAARVERPGGGRADVLGLCRARGDREQRGVAALRVEPERRDPARDLALVEPVVLEVLEQVAGEPELRRRDRVAA